jgi:hypothetical protein
MGEVATPEGRRRRRLLHLLGLALALAALAAAPDGWLPWLANRAAARVLRQQGLDAIRLRIERLTPWQVSASLVAGDQEPRLRLHRVEAHFSPAGLLRRRVASVTLAGGVVPLRIATNGGPLPALPWDTAATALHPPEEERDSPAAAVHRSAWQVGAIVADGIELSLAARANGPTLSLPLRLSAVGVGGQTRFEAALGRAASIRLRGDLDLAGGTGRVEADVPVAGSMDLAGRICDLTGQPRPALPDLEFTGPLRASVHLREWQPQAVSALVPPGRFEAAGNQREGRAPARPDTTRRPGRGRAPESAEAASGKARVPPGEAVQVTWEALRLAADRGTNGWQGDLSVAGIVVRAAGAECRGNADASFAAGDALDAGNVVLTTRMTAADIPGGGPVFTGGVPLAASVSARASRAPGERGGQVAWDGGVVLAPFRWGDTNSAISMPDAMTVFFRGEATGSSVVLRVQGSPAHFGFQGGQTATGSASLILTGHLRAENRVAAYDASLDVANGFFRDARGVRLDGLAVRLPFHGSNGSLRADAPEATWSNLTCHGVRIVPGTAALTATGAMATVALPLSIPDLGLRANVRAQASWFNGWQMAVTAEVPAAGVADTAALRGVLKRLTGQEIAVSGQVAAEATATFAPGRTPHFSGEAAVSNLDLSCDAFRSAVSGLTARVAFRGDTFWHTAGSQQAAFRTAVANGIPLEGGDIRWQFNRDTLLVERAEFGWCGGMLRAYGVPLDLHDPRADFDLYADKIQLGRLLRLVKTMPGSGDGVLYGRVPLRIERGQLRLAESYLHSQPGETGVLRVHDVSFLDQALAQSGVAAAVREKLQKTLQDLTFTVLRFDLDPGRGEDAVLRVQLKGAPGTDKTLPPVDLDVRVRGTLESLFNVMMKVAR